MRHLKTFPNRDAATRLGDFLTAEDIENRIDPAANDTFELWIYDEDAIDRAVELLGQFEADPDHPKFSDAAKIARRKKAAEERSAAEYARKHHDMDESARRILFAAGGPVIFSLILLSLLVFVYSGTGANVTKIRHLFIQDFTRSMGDGNADFSSVRDGEIWRLVTPILIHFGFIHFFFNMYWLFQFGKWIEARQGSLFLLLFIAVTALVSNCGQYIATGWPLFGGMSGVVYGLFGYLWIRGKFDPATGYLLRYDTIAWMLLWFGACAFGLVGNIANWAHGVGFAVGMLWGYLASGHFRNYAKKVFGSK